jgi:serine/threonine-protein phosphatase 2A regulatory subunit A
MVKQLAIWDNFPSRASAAYFLSTCYDRLNEDESKKEVVALFKELSQDDTPMVRRAVADNIGKLAIVVDNHTRKTTLYEVWA